MPLGRFKDSRSLSMGIELELQLLSADDYDLTGRTQDLIDYLARRPPAGEIKPEITESMLEVSTGVHDEISPLVTELRSIRDSLLDAAESLTVFISGGGSHPFQHWPDRSIFATPRFLHLWELYGYLAKQFTVFGLHVHVGCSGGDEALYLLHSLSRYVPQFIALAASSPFYQGTDTTFDSSRLTSIFAFPLSGRAPLLLGWGEFERYFAKMESFGVVDSMKDFYWDIRPRPEYGTIEVRVCDAPLTVERAAVLAAYIQALCRYLLETRPHTPTEDDYVVYTYNRFAACRFGLDGSYIDPRTAERRPLREDIAATLDLIAPHARALGSTQMLTYVGQVIDAAGNEARWIRATLAALGSFPALMQAQADRWRTNDLMLVNE